MDDANSIRVPAICDCGAQFEIPIAGLELEGLEFTCPGCGNVDRFTEQQIASIVSQYEAIRAVAADEAGKAVSDTLQRAARGSKHLRYRPK